MRCHKCGVMIGIVFGELRPERASRLEIARNLEFLLLNGWIVSYESGYFTAYFKEGSDTYMASGDSLVRMIQDANEKRIEHRLINRS